MWKYLLAKFISLSKVGFWIYFLGEELYLGVHFLFFLIKVVSWKCFEKIILKVLTDVQTSHTVVDILTFKFNLIAWNCVKWFHGKIYLSQEFKESYWEKFFVINMILHRFHKRWTWFFCSAKISMIFPLFTPIIKKNIGHEVSR